MKLVLLVALMVGTAHADDVADIKKVQSAFLAHIGSFATGDPVPAPVTPDSLVITTWSDVDGAPAKLADGRGGDEVFPGLYIDTPKARNVRVGLARDGASAWVSFGASTEGGPPGNGTAMKINVRVSNLVVKSGGTWLVHASSWSEGRPDADVNAEAKLGAEPLKKLADTDIGDASLNAAFDTLIAKGYGVPNASINIGSDPKETAVSARALASGFKKAWVGKTKVIGGKVAILAPSGTTGAVWANVDLTKTAGKATYTIPFRLFVIFDKQADGSWAAIHSHFAVR